MVCGVCACPAINRALGQVCEKKKKKGNLKKYYNPTNLPAVQFWSPMDPLSIV